MNVYTIEKVERVSGLLHHFFYSEAPYLAAMFGHELDWKNFDFDRYVRNHHVWICWREGKIVGIMMAQLYGSVFDPESKILWQDSLYVTKSSGKAAFLLLKEFIAFGQARAKYVFTCKTKNTNIKERTFKRLGFEKTEELYRMVTGGI